MSFIWQADQPLRTPEQVAKVIYDTAVSMGLDEFYAHCALACVAVESDYWCPWNPGDPTSQNYPFDSESNDGRSVGYYQQQNAVPGENPPTATNWWGPMSDRMTLENATRTFLSRMPDGLSAATSVYDAGQAIANTQGCAPEYRGRYAEEWAAAGQVLTNALKGAPEPTQPPSDPVEEPPVATSAKPAFNEFAIWSPSTESRQGTLPRILALHTQEPTPTVNHGPPADNAAEALGNFCAQEAPEVSYHLYISQASDGGVTVVDGVDTDVASWSVGNANHISINYCFAGSYAGWTRAEWLKYASNAIDVAAWYAVQDIAKYPSIAAKIIGFGGNYPGSTADDSGITDHQWVTDVFGWGTHTDVGANFPADYFADRFAYWLAGGESQAPPPVIVVPPPVDPRVAMAQAFFAWATNRDTTTERDLLEYLVLQIGTGHPAWPSSGRTVRDQLFYGNETPT